MFKAHPVIAWNKVSLANETKRRCHSERSEESLSDKTPLLEAQRCISRLVKDSCG